MVIFIIGIIIIISLDKAKSLPFSTFNSVQPGYTAMKHDASLNDILPVQPEGSGDIPKLVGILREALKTKNKSICDSIPEPQVQKYWFDDYSDYAPSQKQWKMYCLALVTENPKSCDQIGGAYPNLGEECQVVLEMKMKQKNNNPSFCFTQYQNLYSSADEVANCYSEYYYKNVEMSLFDTELYACFRAKTTLVDSIGSEQDKCLYELAVKTNQKKICDLIRTPYYTYQFSGNNCRGKLWEMSRVVK
jgi:hypothetical protein